jgi:ubiquitin carboxyl-terminal hydrolase 4/11
VRTKPYVESVDSDGKNEKEIAKKSWENHLLRNRSHIVDLMHGQYRSQLTCPECKKISITYDPFSTLTLPIPGKESKTIEFFFIHHDNHDKPYKLSMRFKPNNHKIADLKRETATLLNKDVNTFDFVFLTYTSVKKDLKSSMDTVDARKKRKLLNMFALEKSPEVISWPQEDIIEVHILMSKNVHYYSNSYIKRTFTFMRPFWFLKSMTLSDIHMRIFHYYRFLFEEYDADTEAEKKKLRETSDEELYEKYFSKPKERPYKVLLVTNARYQTPCFYCGDPKCENCELPNHQNVLLSTIMAKIREEEDAQNKFAFELEVYWDRAPENFDLSRMNSCVDYQKKLKEGAASNGPDFKETPGAKADCKTIYDCFEFFQSPETLGEDNEWYCNICKKHQRATKQMSLYKAPRILVIHLKRFKGSGSYNKSKITDRIDFPIEDLDLSNYVRDSSLPEDYENESILQSITGGMEIEEKATEEGMELESNKEQKIQEEPLEMVKPEIITEEQKEGTEKENTIEMEIKKGPVGGDQNDKVLYDLYAVSNHYGNLGFGHYTAYAKNNGEWYYFDDSSVSKARKSDIPGEASYLLFYKRKNLSELKHKTATEVTQSEV